MHAKQQEFTGQATKKGAADSKSATPPNNTGRKVVYCVFKCSLIMVNSFVM